MEQYEPESDFLIAIVNREAPLSGSEFGEHNLQRLIAMMRDEDRSNRDWATFVLAQQDFDTPEIRNALLRAAAEDDSEIRGEAIWGLARRDPDLALPLVREALLASQAAVPTFEAAALIAHNSLIEPLSLWSGPSDDSYFDNVVADALRACETGVPADR